MCIRDRFRADYDTEMAEISECLRAELPTGEDRDASMVMTATVVEGNVASVQITGQRPADEQLAKLSLIHI